MNRRRPPGACVRHRRGAGSLALLLMIGILPGCLLVRSTEHHVRLNPDGSGEAVLRLYDLRSDGATDSAIASDVSRLLAAANGSGTSLFEQNTRKIQNKQFMLNGDTLSMRIAYAFRSLEAIEGLRANAEQLFLVVGPENEVVRTNGKIESWLNDTRRIVWPREASRLSYIIRERFPRKSSSIVRWYRQLTQ